MLSQRHVVTAAHCIQSKGDEKSKKASDALFFIGKYNLDSWSEDGYVESGASKLIVHPDWDINSDRYDSDLAIVVLSKPVVYTNYIKPICLWSSPSTDIRDIEGTEGIVVGWGKTEDDVLSTSEPKLVKVPIVDDGECLRSNERFSVITSKRTFCAGGRDGKGPCNGKYSLFHYSFMVKLNLN